MRKNSFSTDRIIGLSAMLISLLTLIIFIYQTNLMRVQSRLSVTPRLSFNTMEIGKDSLVVFKTEIINKGLGPAIVESIYILHEEEKHKLDFAAFIEATYPDLEKYGSLVQSATMSKGSTLLPGESNPLFTYEIEISKIPEVLQYMGIQEEDIPFEVEVIYASIYNERWRMNNKADGHPTPL